MVDELHEATTSTELFPKIGEVDVQERKTFGQDPPGSGDSSTVYDQNFRETLFKDFADLYSDTLPHNLPCHGTCRCFLENLSTRPS